MNENVISLCLIVSAVIVCLITIIRSQARLIKRQREAMEAAKAALLEVKRQREVESQLFSQLLPALNRMKSAVDKARAEQEAKNNDQ